MYKKKEIINPERFCDLKSCRHPFTATRQNQMFHTHQCAEKQWRLDHPRIYFHGSPSWKAERSKPAKNPHRDTPQTWMRYMKANPEYGKMVLRGQSLTDCINSIIWN